MITPMDFTGPICPKNFKSFLKLLCNFETPFYRKLLHLLIFFLFCFYSNTIFCQVPIIQWQKSLGGSATEQARCIEPTSDGGYIIAGYSYSNNGNVSGNHGGSDYWIVKLNAAGNIQWQKSLGGSQIDEAYSIKETFEGDYVIAGYSLSNDGDVYNNHGNADYWIIKIDATGNTLWARCMGGSKDDRATSIQLTTDDGYIVSGYSSSSDGDVISNHGNRDLWILKLNSVGVIQWQSTLGGSGDEPAAYSVRQTTDGGYVVAAYSNSNDGDVSGNHGDYDSWVVKLNASGVLQWQKSLGGSNFEDGKDIIQTSDGGYMFLGMSSSNDGDITGSHGNADYWIVKLNASGNIQWQKPLGGSNGDVPMSFQRTPDGGYLLVGYSSSNDGDITINHGGPDFWVMKLDAAANIQWQKSLGGSDLDLGFSIRQTTDGGYIIVGSSGSTDGDVTGNHGDADFWIVKLCMPLLMPGSITGNISPCENIATTYSIATVSGATSYTWAVPAGWTILSGQGTTSISVKPGTVSGNITVTANNICGSSPPQTLAVTTTSPLTPAVSITSTSTNICSGSSITFTATSTNGGTTPVYQWKKNGTNVGTNSTTYTDAAFNKNDIVTCELTSSEACVTSPTATSNGITITVSAKLIPTVSITSTSTNVCSGSSITFTATPANGGTTPVYQWKKNGTNVGTNSATYIDASLNNADAITCELTSSEACVTSSIVTSNGITITTGALVTPVINITSTSTNICSGSSITFTATSTNGGTTPVYQWKKNGTDVGTNSATYTDAALNNNDIITCELTSSQTCVTSPTAISNAITITASAQASVNITSSATTICKDDEVKFQATVTNGGASLGYQWKLNGENTGTNSSTFAAHGFSDNDEIMCIVNSQGNSCSVDGVASNIISITINPLPVISIIPSDTTVATGSQVQLKALISGNIDSYEWLPASSLMNANTLSPVTVPVNQSTDFWLNIKSEDGCPVTAKSTVHILKILLMPSAFTPNGDKINDVFRIPPNTSFKLKDFSVYNRWGQRVFFTSDINKGWDGLNYPVGTYTYFINGFDYSNKPVFIKGTVTLLR